MNDDGNSDKPIVPKKAANKGSGRPNPAERLEGRGLAKGNLGEQSRFWTQGQVDLQHALDRIRNAARTATRHYLRQEPGAVIPHAGICAGGGPERAIPTATGHLQNAREVPGKTGNPFL